MTRRLNNLIDNIRRETTRIEMAVMYEDDTRELERSLEAISNELLAARIEVDMIAAE